MSLVQAGQLGLLSVGGFEFDVGAAAKIWAAIRFKSLFNSCVQLEGKSQPLFEHPLLLATTSQVTTARTCLF